MSIRRGVKFAAAPIRESEILRQVLALKPLNTDYWRNTRGRYLHHQSGQWISYGLGPNGASDCIGYRVIRITPDMVGKRVAQFLAIETKAPGEQSTEDQDAFIDNIRAAGGCAGVVYSVEEAARLLGVLS